MTVLQRTERLPRRFSVPQRRWQDNMPIEDGAE